MVGGVAEDAVCGKTECALAVGEVSDVDASVVKGEEDIDDVVKRLLDMAVNGFVVFTLIDVAVVVMSTALVDVVVVDSAVGKEVRAEVVVVCSAVVGSGPLLPGVAASGVPMEVAGDWPDTEAPAVREGCKIGSPVLALPEACGRVAWPAINSSI